MNISFREDENHMNLVPASEIHFPVLLTFLYGRPVRHRVIFCRVSRGLQGTRKARMMMPAVQSETIDGREHFEGNCWHIDSVWIQPITLLIPKPKVRETRRASPHVGVCQLWWDQGWNNCFTLSIIQLTIHHLFIYSEQNSKHTQNYQYHDCFSVIRSSDKLFRNHDFVSEKIIVGP